MSDKSDTSNLADETFSNLTTFKKNGEDRSTYLVHLCEKQPVRFPQSQKLESQANSQQSQWAGCTQPRQRYRDRGKVRRECSPPPDYRITGCDWLIH